ncbi:hypothetical protein ACFYEP_04235 [Streptococcus pyogenes]
MSTNLRKLPVNISNDNLRKRGLILAVGYLPILSVKAFSFYSRQKKSRVMKQTFLGD